MLDRSPPIFAWLLKILKICAGDFCEPAIQRQFARLLSYPLLEKRPFSILLCRAGLFLPICSLKNDFISLWKLRSPSVLSLFYCLQMLRTVSVNGFEYNLRFVPGWFKLFSRVTCHRVSTLCLANLFIFFLFVSGLSTVPFGDVWKLELRI